MVATNVLNVLPDGVITEMELTVPECISVKLCRKNADELFQIMKVDVQSDDAEVLTVGLKEINKVLSENGVAALVVEGVLWQKVEINI